MPKRLEEQRDMIDKSINFLSGDVEKMADEDYQCRWYDYANLYLKIFTPILSLILLIFKIYKYALLFFIFFMLDMALFLFNMNRVRRYEEYKKLEGQVEIPKGRWNR